MQNNRHLHLESAGAEYRQASLLKLPRESILASYGIRQMSRRAVDSSPYCGWHASGSIRTATAVLRHFCSGEIVLPAFCTGRFVRTTGHQPHSAGLCWRRVCGWHRHDWRVVCCPAGWPKRLLHKHRITDRVGITLKERAIVEYVRQNPGKAIPGPFMFELWRDDDFYLRLIEARDKTLSSNQV